MPTINPSPGASPVPLAQAGPTPRPIPERPLLAAPLSEDKVMRPIAAPSPGEVSHKALGAYDSLPILAAAGVLVVGAAAAAPGIEIVAGAAAKAEDLGGALGRGAAFAKTAGQSFAAEYRAAASKVTSVKWNDPSEVGKALGAQGWIATEEFGRSAIVGAGVAGGAWAARSLTAAAQNAALGSHNHARKP